MKIRQYLLSLFLLFPFFVFWTSSLFAHTIHYAVLQKGIAVKIFYAEKDPASYAQYEIYGPAESLPHQTGRTDKNGLVCFVPDRAGTWKIKVWGDSSHGLHGLTMDINVNEALDLQSFSKPLVALHTKLIVGVSVIFGLFGLYALLKSRRNP